MTPEKRRRLMRMRRRRLRMMRKRRGMRGKRMAPGLGIGRGRKPGGKVRRRTAGMGLRKRFARLVKRYILAKQNGDDRKATLLARRITRLANGKPRLQKTRAYAAFIRTRGYTTGRAAPQSVSAIPLVYSPSTGQSAADSAEGEVVDYPDSYEDLPDEDEDYSMDGYGMMGGFAQRDMLDKLYMIGFAGGAAAAVAGKTKKMKKQGQMVAAVSGGLFLLKHIMTRQKTEAVVGALGELEIMDNPAHYGELEIMDGYGGHPYDNMSNHNFGMPGDAAVLGSYGELEIMGGL
jgi:hypothetical protein